MNGSSFNQALHDGVFIGAVTSTEENTEASDDTATAAPSGNAARALVSSAQGSELELTLYTKVGMGDGQQANNPWLQGISRSYYQNNMG